jgi:hypothetical protein
MLGIVEINIFRSAHCVHWKARRNEMKMKSDEKYIKFCFCKELYLKKS